MLNPTLSLGERDYVVCTAVWTDKPYTDGNRSWNVRLGYKREDSDTIRESTLWFSSLRRAKEARREQFYFYESK